MQLFIIPILVMVATQAIKLGLEVYHGTFAWSHLNSYGGMPSAHAAFATSLAYTLAYYDGVDTAGFAVAIVLLIVIVRDAMGFRHQLGIHGAILNRLIKELPDDREYRYPVLSERLGHTLPEVTVGVIVGIMGSMVLIAVAALF
jgi:uncharacterized protein